MNDRYVVYVRNGGTSFLGLLTVAFVVLKLLGEIDWSWWWVTSPILIPALVAVAIIGLAFVGLVVAFAVKWIVSLVRGYW